MVFPASSTRRRLSLAAAVLGLLALMGTACRPVQLPGVYPWDPTGSLESVVGGNGEVRVVGWASQWDLFVDGDDARDQGPVQIVININGEWVEGAFPASDPRADVDTLLVAQGLWQIRQDAMGYGFDVTVPAAAGETTVCVAALNQNLDVLDALGPGIGDHVLLGCRTVTVTVT